MMLGIIPARKGSKGIIDKNITMVGGIRLIDYTIRSALHILPLVITTDYYDINFGIDTISRPMHLCMDKTPMIPVIKHAIKTYEKNSNIKITSICLLQPTSPLRSTKDILNCIDIYKERNVSVVSGSIINIKQNNKVFDKKTSKKHFQRNGAIFIASRKMINDGKLFDSDSYRYVMPTSRSIDIDTEDDLFIAESIIKNKGVY